MSKLSNVSKAAEHSESGSQKTARAHVPINLLETQILIFKLRMLHKII